MKWHEVSRKTIILAITAVLFMALLGVAQATLSGVNNLGWQADPLFITSGTDKGNGPVMLVAPSGDLMILYSRWTGNDVRFSKPYFRTSTNNGASWESAGLIPSSNNNLSQMFVEGAYDEQSVAHVAMLEFTPANPFPTSVIFYTRRTGNAWTTPIEIMRQTNLPVPTKSVAIVNSGPATLDIIWDEDDRLRHRRSTDGGVTWSVAQAVAGIGGTGNVENKVKMVGDGAGSLYVVWQQRAAGVGSGTNIYFSKYNGATWTTPIILSNNPQTDANKSNVPVIAIAGNNIEVVYSYTDTSVQSSPQFLVRRSCPLTADCGQVGNWNPSVNVSSRVFVNSADPFYVLSDLSYDGSIPGLFVYYHGIPSNAEGQPAGSNEAIFGTNSCEEWGSIDQVTSLAERAGNPSIAVHNKTVHIAYDLLEEGTVGGDYRVMYNRAPFTINCVDNSPTATPVVAQPTATHPPIVIPTRSPNDVLLPYTSKLR
jgi:hypothetical protein